MRVLVTDPFDYNATGFDRDLTHFPAGNQNVSPRVAEYIERAELGRVLQPGEAAPELPDAGDADEPQELAELREQLKKLQVQATDSLTEKAARISALEAELASAKQDVAAREATVELAKARNDELIAAAEARVDQPDVDVAALEAALKQARSEAFIWRLESLKVDGLKAFAAENGYDLGTASTREELIAAIKTAAAAAPAE